MEQNDIAHVNLGSDSGSCSERSDTPPYHRLVSKTRTNHEHCDIESAAHAAATLSPSRNPSLPLLRVVAVTVSGPRSDFNTYAMLDDGCTATFIDSKIADAFGAVGPTK